MLSNWTFYNYDILIVMPALIGAFDNFLFLY